MPFQKKKPEKSPFGTSPQPNPTLPQQEKQTPITEPVGEVPSYGHFSKQEQTRNKDGLLYDKDEPQVWLEELSRFQGNPRQAVAYIEQEMVRLMTEHKPLLRYIESHEDESIKRICNDLLDGWDNDRNRPTPLRFYLKIIPGVNTYTFDQNGRPIKPEDIGHVHYARTGIFGDNSPVALRAQTQMSIAYDDSTKGTARQEWTGPARSAKERRGIPLYPQVGIRDKATSVSLMEARACLRQYGYGLSFPRWEGKPYEGFSLWIYVECDKDA